MNKEENVKIEEIFDDIRYHGNYEWQNKEKFIETLSEPTIIEFFNITGKSWIKPLDLNHYAWLCGLKRLQDAGHKIEIVLNSHDGEVVIPDKFLSGKPNEIDGLIITRLKRQIGRFLDFSNQKCQLTVSNTDLNKTPINLHMLSLDKAKNYFIPLYLDPVLTPACYLYQFFFLDTDDNDAIEYLKKLTLLSPAEIESIIQRHQTNPGIRLLQRKLAYEVIKDIRGKNSALVEAIHWSGFLFNGKDQEIAKLTADQIERMFGCLKIKLPKKIKLIDLLITLNAAKDYEDARQLIDENNVSINGEKVGDINKEYTISDAMAGKYLIVKLKETGEYYLGDYYLGEF